MKKSHILSLFLALLCNANYFVFAQTSLIKKTIVGGEEGWDYLSVSHEDRRIYLSHSNQVEVLNVDTHEKIGTIADTKGVHGIVALPKIEKGFITAGKTNSVVVFNTKTLEKISEIPTGDKPDALLFDSFSNRIFVFNHKGGSVTAIDVNTLKALKTIKLGGSAVEAGVSDEKGSIFVNLEDLNEIIVFDAKTLDIKKHFKIGKGEEPTGMAIDLKSNRLFTACGNEKMIILDATTGKIFAELAIGKHCDGLVFDPVLKNIYTSNGEGTMTIIHEESANLYKRKETVTTAVGARTICIDPSSQHVFTISAQFGEIPSASSENPNPRPKIIPNTFMLLEYGITSKN